MGDGPDTAAVRDAFAALSRSFKRVSVYRHAREQHLAYLEPAAAELRNLLEQRAEVTVAVEPVALVYEGEVVHSEPARDTGFCFRLHRDGIRSLTLRRGISGADLLALAQVALADPLAEGGREDAVTELWKADLAHVGYTAISGYRMDDAAGAGAAASVAEIGANAHAILDQHVGERVAEFKEQPLLWTDAERQKRDPDDGRELSRRAALTILLIVEQEYAGWDLAALEETFWRLVEQMVERGQMQAVAQTLDRARRLAGAHAKEFRAALGKQLAGPARLERLMQAATGAERPPLVPAWLQLLPDDAGPAILSVLPLGREPSVRVQIAAAALSRAESCAEDLDRVLRRGGPAEAHALLAAIAILPPSRRAGFAAAAVANPDAGVKVEALPLLTSDAPLAVRNLGPLLTTPARPVRLLAAQTLAGCVTLAEPAAALLLAAITRPQFAESDREEQTAFYRALGGLGSLAGHAFLVERLARRAKGFFGKRKGVDEQLLAVQGLAEGANQRSLKALDEALQQDHPAAVQAACKAAAQHLRSAPRAGRRP